ncbi:hypothetical protein ACFL27_20630 [candidate division CSSED10-310 bacterium]|uniref:Uncharacterized protein n=1 Tax=candidate division CSSED10-310 bacterium TaxID=2855610 RepID=A0ABV6Z2D7_UNCC1
MVAHGYPEANQDKIKTYRWFFYLSLIQFLAYFIIPIFLFPSRVILHIELISALTLGLVVALFFLLVNVCGLYIDRNRRSLHITMLLILGLYFSWALISWSYIERMDYILR